MDDTALRAYLDGHRSGAATVIRLVDGRLERGAGPAWLSVFREQLDDERAVVDAVAARLDAAGRAPTRVIGAVVHGAARLGLRASRTLHPQLDDLLELETMYVGVQGKMAMWRTLRVHRQHPALRDVDLDDLAERAREQSAQLESHRLAAAAALG